jgi:hypothetical protein
MHKVFISYHHRNDQWYKDELVRMNDIYNIFIDRSIQTGDISENLEHQTIRRIIRDDRLRDSTVTILLLGTETRYRKHVDWELKSSMINGAVNKRSGILVITLPSTNCSSFKTAYAGEDVIYPDATSWMPTPTRTDLSLHFPYMPKRILDNLAKPDVKISVVPWSKIWNSPETLRFLVRETSEARFTNEYDLSEPMRMRDYNPNFTGGSLADLLARNPFETT